MGTAGSAKWLGLLKYIPLSTERILNLGTLGKTSCPPLNWKQNYYVHVCLNMETGPIDVMELAKVMCIIFSKVAITSHSTGGALKQQRHLLLELWKCEIRVPARSHVLWRCQERIFLASSSASTFTWLSSLCFSVPLSVFNEDTVVRFKDYPKIA